jgi:hypothetical protein
MMMVVLVMMMMMMMMMMLEGKDCRGHSACEVSWLIVSYHQQEHFCLSGVILIEFS